MKIIVLQLARFGDIYQSWPALRALKRSYPQAHITLVVREKFKAAVQGLDAVDELVTLDTAKVLSPIIFQNSAEGALAKIQDFLSSFEVGAYDRIVNLSFSPFSSYLTQALAGPHTIVTGYTRHADGFFAVPDDASAYFYAQVGNDRWNRVHLTDLFALIAGVELQSCDWSGGRLASFTVATQGEYIALQAGASQGEKTLSPQQWEQAIETILHETDFNVVLLGSKEERHLYRWPQHERVIDLMGQSSLFESMAVIAKASAFIGPDSVGLHMASLTGTRTFNISVGPVRFWETGPRAAESVVWRIARPEDFTLKIFMREFHNFIHNIESDEVYRLRQADGVAYYGPATDVTEEFQWRLTQALYMHSDYPTPTERSVFHAFARIHELAGLGLEQVEGVRNESTRQISLSILSEIDHLLEKVCELEPKVKPLANWFLTQKLRIGPMAFEEVIAQTRNCFADLQTITQVYALPVEWNERNDLTWKP